MGAGASRSEALDKVVLITGCSDGGIGHALATAFAKQGCKVIASARSLASLKSLLDFPHIHCISLDVTLDSSIKEAVESILKKYGRLDILVNNAAMSCYGPIAELPTDHLEKAFQTNVLGALKLIQASVPVMVAQGGGKIVNVGSVGAYVSTPWAGGYAASKSALHALTDSMRVELRPFNIGVILLVPGAITSNFASNALDLFSKIQTWKLYKPFEQAIRTRIMLSQGPRSTPADDFAKRAVEAIFQENPPQHFVYGYRSMYFCFMYYLPMWFRDFSLGRTVKALGR